MKMEPARLIQCSKQLGTLQSQRGSTDRT